MKSANADTAAADQNDECADAEPDLSSAGRECSVTSQSPQHSCSCVTFVSRTTSESAKKTRVRPRARMNASSTNQRWMDTSSNAAWFVLQCT